MTEEAVNQDTTAAGDPSGPVDSDNIAGKQPDPTEHLTRGQRFFRSLWREWIKPIAPVVLVLLAIRSSLADWNDVPTGSMKPTILEGDRIFVNKSAFDLRVPFSSFFVDGGWSIMHTGDPQRGDVIVFFSSINGVRMVKRVIAVPGDEVKLIENRLTVNGVEAEYEEVAAAVTTARGVFDVLEETTEDGKRRIMWATPGGGRSHSDHWTWNPDGIVIPEDQYFVMGDNRDDSTDARFWGLVPRANIVGRSIGIIVSLDIENKYKPRWDRFFSGLD